MSALLDHAEVQERFGDLLDAKRGAVDPSIALSIAPSIAIDLAREHVTTCDTCAREFQLYEKTVSLLRGAPPLSASPGFAERVRAATQSSASRTFSRRERRLAWSRIAAPANAVSTVLLMCATVAALLLAMPAAYRRVADDASQPALQSGTRTLVFRAATPEIYARVLGSLQRRGASVDRCRALLQLGNASHSAIDAIRGELSQSGLVEETAHTASEMGLEVVAPGCMAR